MLETPVQLESNLHQSLDSKVPVRRQNPYRCQMAAFDYWLLGILAFLMIPAFIAARLPFRMNIPAFAGFFWLLSSVRSAFVAILLAVLGLPFEQMLLPVLRRYWSQKIRIAIALVVAVELAYACGLWTGLMVAVDALALAELMERKRDAFERSLLDFFWPGLYLFLSLIVVFALNTAIVGIRYFAAYDRFFNHLDWVLFHLSVSSLSYWALSHFPRWLSMLLDLSYFGMFSQLGAALFLTALLGGQRHAMRYVRTLLICYTIALTIYFMLPAKGPYFISPNHETNYPHFLMSYSAQQSLGDDAKMLWSHHVPPSTDTIGGYYISFPCMHIALALTSFWFLLPWKRIAAMVFAFDAILLIPAILLLEWHYLIGILAGIPVVFLSIWISGRVSGKRGRSAFTYRVLEDASQAAI